MHYRALDTGPPPGHMCTLAREARAGGPGSSVIGLCVWGTNSSSVLSRLHPLPVSTSPVARQPHPSRRVMAEEMPPTASRPLVSANTPGKSLPHL